MPGFFPEGGLVPKPPGGSAFEAWGPGRFETGVGVSECSNPDFLVLGPCYSPSR